jgi:hypothetical protein
MNLKKMKSMKESPEARESHSSGPMRSLWHRRTNAGKSSSYRCSNPLLSVLRDLGHTIIAKEVRRYQDRGLGSQAPPSPTWDAFAQIEFFIGREREVLSVRTITGLEIPNLAHRLAGIKACRYVGTDRAFIRIWLKKHPGDLIASRGQK